MNDKAASKKSAVAAHALPAYFSKIPITGTDSLNNR
jgi:hypothetical protein